LTRKEMRHQSIGTEEIFDLTRGNGTPSKGTKGIFDLKRGNDTSKLIGKEGILVLTQEIET